MSMEPAVRARQAEKKYWKMIARERSEGLTPEQARENIYQDLINWGQPELAAAVRKYQDRVHLLKLKKETPPPQPETLHGENGKQQ